MNPFRCSNCDKLLGMIEGKAEIKCSKCKTMNRTHVVLMNLNHGIIVCTREEAEEIQAKQMVEMLNNGFTTTNYQTK